MLTSASAKTALATAYQLRSLGGHHLIGLTSSRNLDYVQATGLYNQSATYETVADLHFGDPIVYVDFLGRLDVTAQLHRALGPSVET